MDTQALKTSQGTAARPIGQRLRRSLEPSWVNLPLTILGGAVVGAFLTAAFNVSVPIGFVILLPLVVLFQFWLAPRSKDPGWEYHSSSY